MKKLLVLVFIALIPLSLRASQRVMVFEDFTATWCQYCPGAARGLERTRRAGPLTRSSASPTIHPTAATRTTMPTLRPAPAITLSPAIRRSRWTATTAWSAAIAQRYDVPDLPRVFRRPPARWRARSKSKLRRPTIPAPGPECSLPF